MAGFRTQNKSGDTTAATWAGNSMTRLPYPPGRFTTKASGVRPPALTLAVVLR